MYFNKELYINEEIRAKEKRLNKLQTALAISITISFIAIYIACVVPLRIKYAEKFMAGYAIAILYTSVFVVIEAVVFPISAALRKLKVKQTEELKGKPIYNKYVALLYAGRELYKVNNCIAICATAVGLVVTWILAIIFPYEIYVFVPCMLIVNVCNLIILIRNGKIKQIKYMEEEIAQGLLLQGDNDIFDIEQ